jgi:putative ABC transport system permease protein
VSVVERTEEIGIRSAIGASPRQILRQFLVEGRDSVGTGAALGVVLGVSVAALVTERWVKGDLVIRSSVRPSSASPSASSSVAARSPGIKLDPVEALRHE